jgi:hypothetical protein
MMRVLLTVLVLALGLASGASAFGAGSLDVSPGSVDFGTIAVGDTPTRSVTLTNNTGLPVAILSISVTGSGSFSRSGGSCADGVTVLAAGGDSCTVQVQYSPSSVDPDSGNLDVVDDTGTETVSLSGAGVDPVVIQPGSLSFGTQRAGTSSSQQPVTVTNNRTSSINLDVSKSGPNPADFIIQGASSCDTSSGGTLSAGSSCNIQVVFSPNAVGARQATVSVAGQAIDLTGTGVAPGIAVNPSSIAFGNQPIFTSSAARTITVENTGTDALSVGGPTLSGATAQFTISDTCTAASPLAPGGQCTVTIQFAPAIEGPLTATVFIPSELGDQTVTISGTGRPSFVVFKPAPFVFQRVRKAGTASTPKTITLSNRTNGPLTISKVALTGVNPSSFRIVSSNCQGKTLAADATCTETVRFAPNDVGAKSALLTVTDDAPNSPHVAALSGKAAYPKNDRAVLGSVGCNSVRITWRPPTGSRYANTRIVRNHKHVPTNPDDGTRVAHSDGVMNDTGLSHFTTYFYRVFARYHSHVRRGTFNHSRGTILREHTGQICTPKQNGTVHDATLTATWLAHSSRFGYSFRLYHAGHQVQQAVSIHRTNFTFSGTRRLHRGSTYTLFLYAYPASKPSGVLIGKATFRLV